MTRLALVLEEPRAAAWLNWVTIGTPTAELHRASIRALSGGQHLAVVAWWSSQIRRPSTSITLTPIPGCPYFVGGQCHGAQLLGVQWRDARLIGDDVVNGMRHARVFAGAISDVAVYNSALSPGQILQQFAAGLGVAGFAPQISGLQQTSSTPAPARCRARLRVMNAARGNGTCAYHQSVDVQRRQSGERLLSGGATISGANSNSLTISNLTVNNAGSYQLLVTNVSGVTTSSVVKVTILAGDSGGPMAVGIAKLGRRFGLHAAGHARRLGAKRQHLLDQ